MANQSKNNMRRDWFILRSLVSKDFKLKYRRSVLGVLWSVLNPLLMMCVLTAVFSSIFRFNIEHFPVYLILGQTLFSLMSDATGTSMGSIVEAAPLIKKIRINKAIFPVEKTTFALVNFGFSLLAVIAVMLFFQIAPTVNVLFVPLLLLFVYCFSLGIGFALAALAVFFRDVMHLWSVIITAWTYFTPLFYPVEILPSWAAPIMNFNPMYWYVKMFRDTMMWGNAPTPKELLICGGCGFVTLAIGYAIFSKLQKKFILHV